MNIYTKAGDKGKSYSYRDKKALDKSSDVFGVLGTLDELTTTLGFIQDSKIQEIKKIVLIIQNDLIILGSLLAGKPLTQELKQSFEKRVTEFEKNIDYLNSRLPPLNSFILPGGYIESNYLHLSRVVCRRLERILVKYISKNRKRNLEVILKYINRLSDLLFVMARYANKKKGYKDVLWKALK